MVKGKIMDFHVWFMCEKALQKNMKQCKKQQI